MQMMDILMFAIAGLYNGLLPESRKIRVYLKDKEGRANIIICYQPYQLMYSKRLFWDEEESQKTYKWEKLTLPYHLMC